MRRRPRLKLKRKGFSPAQGCLIFIIGAAMAFAAAFNPRAGSPPAATSPRVTEPSTLPVTTIPRIELYAGANTWARECPYLRCATVGRFTPSLALQVDAMVDGQLINGLSTWYRTLWSDGRLVYVPMSEVTGSLATRAPIQAFSAATATPRLTTPRPRPTTAPAQAAPRCPRNCDEAVAMGVSAQFAASCGLDRDRDGVACYGD